MARATASIGRVVNELEEGVIALLFAAMTLVTFSQVVARYVFNTGVVWALELTVYLFAWLVLFGMSYGVKVHAHLGVDAFVKLFSSRTQRIFGLLAVAAGLIYGAILLIGSWEYVWKLFRIGIESEDLPIPQWVPMAILPIGVALLIYRLAQVGVRIWRGEQRSLLADEAQHTIADFLGQGDQEPAMPGTPPGAGERPR
ncbi:MAG: TRAP transporter small permease [Geminicoccaceae bacterium]